jgi:hypothetical protein
MKKIISVILVLISLATFSASNVFAAKLSPLPTSTPFPSSYELFYPVVAGKTMAESFYFLKTAREWLVDKLTFDPIRNADYHLLLSKKRLIEAEKLLSQKNYSFSQKSLTKSVGEIKNAVETAKKGGSAGKNVADIYNTIKIVGQNEVDFIEISLIKTVPEAEKEFLLNTSKSIRELIQQI